MEAWDQEVVGVEDPVPAESEKANSEEAAAVLEREGGIARVSHHHQYENLRILGICFYYSIFVFLLLCFAFTCFCTTGSGLSAWTVLHAAGQVLSEYDF